jgi:predicted O-methyltransferase YrrM
MRLIIRILFAVRLPVFIKENPMNTLTSAPLSNLISRLFADAEASSALFAKEMAQFTPEERTAMVSSESEYMSLYFRAKDAHLAVSPDTGKLLYMLARSSRARSIVEFGTSFGISTLHLAAALRDNGGGRLITSEFEPSKVANARRNIEAGGLSDLVELRAGDALETLAKNLPEKVDLVLLDGAKALYPRILALIEPRLSAGAWVVADNADWNPEYLKRMRSAEGLYVSVPFASDVEVSMKV